MNRSTAILIVLLAGSLAWAWGASRQPRVGVEENLVPVWRVAPEQVQQVEYRSGDTRVVVSVSARKDGPEKYYWVEAQGQQAPRRQDPRRARAATAAGEEQPANEAFQGGAQTKRFIEEIANLQAVRALGDAKQLKLPDFGLGGDTPAYLQVTNSDAKAPLRLDLGTESSGNATRYGLSSADNRVYLVRNAVFRTLGNARRFMDRELFPFPLQEAQRIELQVGGRRATIYRLEVPPTEQNRWGWTAQDKQGDPLAQEVASGLLRMKSLRYLAEPFDPAKSAVTLSATVFKANEPSATLTVYREGKADVPAVSSHTVRPVALNTGLVNALLKSARTAAERK